MRSAFASAVLMTAALVLSGCPGDPEDDAKADSSANPTASGVGGSGDGGSSTGAGAGGFALGAAGSDSGAGGSQAGSPATAVVPLSPYGSFDVVLATVTANIPMGPADTKSPSAGVKLRFDIPNPPATGSNDAWNATVTPRWGEPSTFAVTSPAGSGTLVLTGSSAISDAPSATAMSSDVWQTFVIALDSAGRAVGAITATGQESVYGSGVGATGVVTAVGTFGRDFTAPAGRTTAALAFGPSNSVMLPWEPVSTTFAEPLTPAQVAAHLSVIDSTGSDAGFAPFAATSDAPDTVSSVMLTWNDEPMSPMLSLSPGYQDPAGNAGEGFDQALTILSVPKGTSISKTFGVSPVTFASWGDPVVPSLTAPMDTDCEGGSCLVIGPFANDFCGVPREGVAGRLMIPTMAQLPGKMLVGKAHLRVRVFVAPTDDAPDSSPYVVGLAPLSIAIARPGQRATITDVTTLPSAVDIGASAGALHYATAWTDVVLPIPLNSSGNGLGGEVGFAIHAGGADSLAACSGTGGSPVTTKILLDSITIE